MTPKRKQRLLLIIAGLIGIGVAVTLTMQALNENLNMFYSPTQVAGGEAPTTRNFRLGGLVQTGSVKRTGEDDGLTVTFDITDGAATVPVSFTGILPDLFREGQGIIALGKLANGGFQAETVVAKHDENYMPPEVAEALDAAGKMAGNTPLQHPGATPN